MSQKYIISVEEIEEYIKYIKKYKKRSEDNKRNIDLKLKNIHNVWNDEVYDRTMVAVDEIGKQLEKLYISLDDTIKCLKKMTKAYDDYLHGGK